MKREGGSGYVAAKEGVVGLMRYYANALGEKNIRVNTVHPAGVASPMVVNDPVKQLLVDEPEWQVALTNPMPVELLEPSDISDTMVYLCGRSGRYVTGVTLPVDAGNAVK
jgi:NAD(P)-dependent dehydrogenase (short-subunit alcohol dehydrogenase family)